MYERFVVFGEGCVRLCFCFGIHLSVRNTPQVNMDDEREMGRGVSRRKTASNLTFCVKKENDGKYRKVCSSFFISYGCIVHRN